MFTFSTGIRTSLLESEEHVCPTCNQSEVSPDALIANKFLRQVRTYKMCIVAQPSILDAFESK